MFKKKSFFPSKKKYLESFFTIHSYHSKQKKGETTIYEPSHIDEAVQKKGK